ncbi:MAG: S-methyl-5-thioribose-1-phosphate isomerase [Saccharofermentanales bacterium]|jgi:methylthioribose-1-phosphate isomerase
MRTVYWEDNKVVMIDQTKLPYSEELIKTRDLKRIADAIYRLELRGGPAIGATACYGMAIAGQDSKGLSKEETLKKLQEARIILNVRPTASNLVWGLDRMEAFAKDFLLKNSVDDLGAAMLEEAEKVADEEVDVNNRMAAFGASLIPYHTPTTILTNCNTGSLCTVDVGHVMATPFLAHKQGKPVHVYTCETRPRLQGAKLNVYELDKRGVPYTLIPDNHAAMLMAMGKIDMVMVGADRMVANGDAAAKVGCYNLAVQAKHHNIPYFFFATTATIDMATENGAGIEIEQRDVDEVRKINGVQVTIPNANVENYAFDVTPNELMTAIITEEGIIFPPYKDKIAEIMAKATR